MAVVASTILGGCGGDTSSPTEEPVAEETAAAIQLETYPDGRADDGEVRLADEPLISGGTLTVEIDVEDCPRPSVGLTRTGTELRIYWHEQPETDQPRLLKIPDLAPPGEYTFWVTCNFANEGPSW
ncbi:MAG: hypothetical protein ACRBI6_02935, partial [Acidimicrobiales bacterium]